MAGRWTMFLRHADVRVLNRADGAAPRTCCRPSSTSRPLPRCCFPSSPPAAACSCAPSGSTPPRTPPGCSSALRPVAERRLARLLPEPGPDGRTPRRRAGGRRAQPLQHPGGRRRPLRPVGPAQFRPHPGERRQRHGADRGTVLPLARRGLGAPGPPRPRGLPRASSPSAGSATSATNSSARPAAATSRRKPRTPACSSPAGPWCWTTWSARYGCSPWTPPTPGAGWKRPARPSRRRRQRRPRRKPAGGSGVRRAQPWPAGQARRTGVQRAGLEAAYKAKIAEAQHEITEGNTYEVCLTTALTARRAAGGAGPVAGLPGAAPAQPGAVRQLPALRRPHRGQHLAGALPADRRRRRDARRADQGHPAPGFRRRPRRAAAPRAGILAQGPGREHHDRGPAPQRPEPLRRARFGIGQPAVRDRKLRHRPPDGEHHRCAAPARACRGPRPWRPASRPAP